MIESTSSSQLAIALIAILASACGPPPDDPSIQTFQTLARAVRAGDNATFWKLLAPASRTALARRVDGDDAVRGEPTGEPLNRMLDQFALRPGWEFEIGFREKPVLDESLSTDRRKILVVESGARRWRIPVVPVNDGWGVDLMSTEVEAVLRDSGVAAHGGD